MLLFYKNNSHAVLVHPLVSQNMSFWPTHLPRAVLVILGVWLHIERSVVRILHWSKLNFPGLKKWISEAPLEQGVNWYPERAVSVQAWYSWTPYVGCTQNREWNSFPRETRTLVSKSSPMTRKSYVKGWPNNKIAESGPTKTGNFMS